MKHFIITHQVWGRQIVDNIFCDTPENAVYQLGKLYCAQIKLISVKEIKE